MRFQPLKNAAHFGVKHVAGAPYGDTPEPLAKDMIFARIGLVETPGPLASALRYVGSSCTKQRQKGCGNHAKRICMVGGTNGNILSNEGEGSRWQIKIPL